MKFFCTPTSHSRFYEILDWKWHVWNIFIFAMSRSHTLHSTVMTFYCHSHACNTTFLASFMIWNMWQLTDWIRNVLEGMRMMISKNQPEWFKYWHSIYGSVNSNQINWLINGLHCCLKQRSWPSTHFIFWKQTFDKLSFYICQTAETIVSRNCAGCNKCN